MGFSTYLPETVGVCMWPGERATLLRRTCGRPLKVRKKKLCEFPRLSLATLFLPWPTLVAMA